MSISQLKFWTVTGKRLETPLEWEPALIELEVEENDSVQLNLQNKSLEHYKKRLKGKWRVVADWPRSNPGYYRLTLNGVEQTIKIAPRKISPEAFECLLQDLESTLPATVAFNLQRGGALAGLKICPPHENTLAAELYRLKRAIEGNEWLIGLKQLLPEMAQNPHQLIENKALWQHTGQARHISPTHLVDCLRGNNLAIVPNNAVLVKNSPLWKSGDRGDFSQKKVLPKRVLVQSVEHNLDVYENRLVKFYVQQVKHRLNRLQKTAPKTLQADIQHLSKVFDCARQKARFLEKVNLLTHLPYRLTMVLLKIPTYRALLENYLIFQRTTSVSLESEQLDSPLENLPKLYQLWGTLQVISVLLNVGIELGYQVRRQQLCVPKPDGWSVQVLPNGQPAVILSHPKSHTTVKLIPERRYSREQTISFTQRPDIAIEIEINGEKSVYLFDPKYKLGSGEDKPQKVDIDKMHAYRDSIINRGQRSVKYAAILYPGESHAYDEGLQALKAQPGKTTSLQEALYQVLKKALL
jgi:predicted component of viral defense system (DUF524 family)